MEFMGRAVGTIVHRPYVFVFFAIYLVAAVTRIGWRRTMLFTVIAYVTAFAAEFSSTRNGVPFGLYHYIDTTRDRELWVSNIPLWDSLSFTFLCYLGWRLGAFVYAPLVVGRNRFQVVDTRAIVRSWRVCLTGALLMTLLDVVIDPLTLLGDRWFLGRIYYYATEGLYFGVPLSNFAGWFAVGTVTIGAYQSVEHLPWFSRSGCGMRDVRLGGLIEPMLYFGILGFNLVLTFAIGERLLGTIGIILYLPVVALLLAHPLNERRRATPDDVAEHQRDYPESPLHAEIRTAGVRTGILE